MRVLLALRLFSALESSLETGRWSPTGIPTVARLIEELDREMELCIVFTSHETMDRRGHGWAERRDTALTIEGLRHSVTVLAGESRFPEWLGRARRWLALLRQLMRLWQLARRFGPDVLYFGHSNVWAAAAFARFGRRPVVLRMTSAFSAREALGRRRVVDWLLRWVYRSPFAVVIATQDGSGGEQWLDRALRPGVSRRLWLNGVDEPVCPASPDTRLAALPADRMIVLFIGALEGYKGCDEFVDAILDLPTTHRDRIHAVMIGSGSRTAAVRERIRKAGAAARFTLIERLPHDQIPEAHARADVYVSLNRFGNLSNANLEAMKAGACMIIPESRPGEGIDLDTDRLIPPDAAVRLPWSELPQALTRTLVELADHPERRAALKRRIAEAIRGRLPSWKERIAQEVALLRMLAQEPSRSSTVRDIV